MKNIAPIILALLITSHTNAETVYKCIDQATKQTTFSGTPCNKSSEKKNITNSSSGFEQEKPNHIENQTDSTKKQISVIGNEKKSEKNYTSQELCAKAQQEYKYEASRISNEKSAGAARRNMYVACGQKEPEDTTVINQPLQRPCSHPNDFNCTKTFPNQFQ